MERSVELGLQKGDQIALNRRTLKKIPYYPTVDDLCYRILNNEGWNYKRNRERYLIRDRSLVSLLYILALRISEALRLKKDQFIHQGDRVLVRGIKLSKSRWKDRQRKEQYRGNNYLPLDGPRRELTWLILRYLDTLEYDDERLFKFTNGRALQITSALLGIPNHWLRAYGEDYLYSMWKHDIIAVSDYVKVDERTLSGYIRRRAEKYPTV